MSSSGYSDILRMPAKKRLDLVEEIWDSLAAEPTSIPVPHAHIVEIQARLANLAENPVELSSWPEVRESVRKQIEP